MFNLFKKKEEDDVIAWNDNRYLDTYYSNKLLKLNDSYTDDQAKELKEFIEDSNKKLRDKISELKKEVYNLKSDYEVRFEPSYGSYDQDIGDYLVKIKESLMYPEYEGQGYITRRAATKAEGEKLAKKMIEAAKQEG